MNKIILNTFQKFVTMNQLFQRWQKVAVLAALLFFVVGLKMTYAQTVDNPFGGDKPNGPLLVNYYTGLLSILTMVWAEVAKALGLKKRVNSFVFVVIAGGITIAGAFIAFDFVDAIQGVFGKETANAPRFKAVCRLLTSA